MPETLSDFRQRRDEEFWTARIPDQDNANLPPYTRWIAANEKKDNEREQTYCQRNAAACDNASGRFEVISINGFEKADIDYTNQLILSCRSAYTVLCLGDIRLAPDAFFMLSRIVDQKPEPDFIYGDEDRMDEGGMRSDPFFKPGWSPDTILSWMYTGGAGIFRTQLLKKVGGLRAEYGAAAFYDLVLRFTEIAGRIIHIPKILCHRMGQESGLFSERNPEGEVRLKEDALRRRKTAGKVTWNEAYREADVIYSVTGEEKVSIIIPSKDHYEMLSDCLASIREHTAYKNYELIIVDNGSCPEQKQRIEHLAGEYKAIYLYQPMQFNFAAMCNLGARRAAGAYLLFLNDDIQAIQPQWLERMLGQAMQKHSGAVGAKLLYPGADLIQHAGIISLENGPAHSLMGLSDREDWYYHRNKVTYNYCAVTGACLMISRMKYEEAGMMDERLSVGYNDVGLCFRLMEMGYQNSVRCDAVLVHYESASRGLDVENAQKSERLKKERSILYQSFPRMEGRDPYYSRNLTQAGIDYSLNLVFPSKPVRHLSKSLRKSGKIVPHSIETIYHIGNSWEITGWISAGTWEEYTVRRFMVLEGEDGSGLCFHLNRIRMDDSKLEEIRNRKGQLFTPYVWFQICIDEKVLQKDSRYEIILMLKRAAGPDIVVRTGRYIPVLPGESF